MFNEKARKRIMDIDETISKLKAEKAATEDELRESCDHDSVIEFTQGKYFLRICAICLFREDGPDYKTLKTANIQGPGCPENKYDKLKPLKTVLVPEEEE